MEELADKAKAPVLHGEEIEGSIHHGNFNKQYINSCT